MASVRINFVQPTQADLVALHIEEAVDSAGPFNEIEVVTPIGTYPDYISHYTTDEATSISNWFRIRFKDSKNAFTDYSLPYKGGSETLVGEIVERVLLRDSSIKEAIAQQEAEAVIQWYYKGVDPYSIDPATVKYTTMKGLTLLTLAYALLFDQLGGGSSSADSWTAGLVSIRSGSTTSGGEADILKLLEQANSILGINVGVIAQMEEVHIAGGMAIVARDQSRLVVEFE